jgi:hypothetical protein
MQWFPVKDRDICILQTLYFVQHIAGKRPAPDPAKFAKNLMTRTSTHQTRNSKRFFKTPIITPRRLVKATTLNLLELLQNLGDFTAAARPSEKEFVHRPKTVGN